MRSFVALLSTMLAGLLAPTVAHGDTFAQYSLQATLNQGTASGTITFNETMNLITGGTVVVDGYTLDYSTGSNLYFTGATFTDSGGDTFNLNIPRITSTFAGGPICSFSVAFCEVPRSGSQLSMLYVALPGGFRRSDTVGSGTLTAIPSVATTPEPSSLALLCTGLLCMAGVVRRTRPGF